MAAIVVGALAVGAALGVAGDWLRRHFRGGGRVPFRLLSTGAAAAEPNDLDDAGIVELDDLRDDNLARY